MDIKFKYSNNQSFSNIISGLFLTTITLFVLNEINLKINNQVGFFLVMLSYFLSAFVFSKAITKGIKMLEIDGESIKITFFNSFKSDLIIKRSDIQITVDNDIIKFYYRDKIKAVAFKKFIIGLEEWNIMVEALKPINKE
jgi:hypothetical protein